jgi:hypothetical protein
MKYWWFRLGIKMGWISEPFCNTHDSNWDYYTQQEIDELEEGGDPCQVVTIVIQ